MLNLNGTLTKAGVRYSTLWSVDFTDDFFLRGLRQWLSDGTVTHDTSHVRPLSDFQLPEESMRIAHELASQLKRDKAILGVFDEGSLGMYNAIIPDELLHPLGVFIQTARPMLGVVYWQHVCVFAVATALAAGCAEHLHSMDRSASWSTGVLFWPPPSATSVWLGEPSAWATLDEASRFIGDALRGAGYGDQRWFPIGAHYEHGFAVTTRLERIEEDGTPKSRVERWLRQYPEAASLHWLAGSAETYLPSAGRYRVLLVAFTDLHVPLRGRPQRWDEGTAMEGPGLPSTEVPARHRVSAGYQVGVYIYEYEATSADGEGALLPPDRSVPGAAFLERSGLSALGL